MSYTDNNNLEDQFKIELEKIDSVLHETEQAIAENVEVKTEPVIENLNIEEEPFIVLTDKVESKNFKYGHILLFVGITLYYELLFHFINFKDVNINVIWIALFAIVTGLVLGLFTGAFPKIINKILAAIFILFECLFALAQFVYHAVFNNYLSLSGTLKFGNQAADNYKTVLENLKQNIISVIFLVLPLIVGLILIFKFIDFSRKNWKFNIILCVSLIIVFCMNIGLMKVCNTDIYDAYNVYKQYTSVDMSIEKLGLYESFVQDIKAGLFGDSQSGEIGFQVEETEVEEVIASTEQVISDVEEGSSTEEMTTEVAIDTSPNILDIDFDAISANAHNDGVTSLCEYFKTAAYTNKNEYTGMFEGYNVIWITAEGYSGYALNSGLYPTLEKLTNEGFVFNNYYQPLWYGSTLGGEYANLTGNPTKNGVYLSMCKAAKYDNGFRFSLANLLNEKGYTCTGYHDNDYTYYDRNITHPALGYNWIGSGNGLEYQQSESGADLWPQSDVVMEQETFKDYKDKEPFHTYYLTVSGHVIYSFGGNDMSRKNQDVVKDYNYSETTLAYLASQYELEVMVSNLIDDLEKNDLLDHTVIILAGDHVPYDNMEILDELSGKSLDKFEKYKSNLIIWSASMEEPVQVDKVCSSIDILPTVLNLMGLEYDSRLITGKDILSTSNGLVLFADRSFITDTYYYNSDTDEATSFNHQKFDVNDVERRKKVVANKFMAADGLTDSKFFSYITND